MKRWVTKHCDADFGKIAERYHISELFAEILVKRGLRSWQDMDAYLFDDMAHVPPAEQMAGLAEAAALLAEKIEQGCSMRIIGDYDVDGVTAAYILYRGLEILGGKVSYRLPHRQRDGYGMQAYMAEQALQDGVDTIITCDNGISAMDAIDRAKALGMSVVLTDHHEVPVAEGQEQLPPADVILDPKQACCHYGYRHLCGAGIAFKLISYMFARQGREKEAEQFLPFAAMATVCDVVPLQGENRVIVKRGLRLVGETNNPGLQALVRQMDFTRELNGADFGFRLGPCINAAGRLEDASKALELFLEQAPERAEDAAAYLYQLNEKRKSIQAQAVESAVRQVEKEGLSKIILVYVPECSESVAGIVAGKLREKYYRPVYVITDSGDCLKGSGRSIPGYHMQQELLACRELLLQFGGHAKAAGFSLEREQLEPLRKKLLERCPLKEQDLVEKLYYDLELSLAQVNPELLQQLSYLEPVGEENEGAVFVKLGAEIVSVRMCGRQNHIAQIQIREQDKWYRAVDFTAEDCLGEAIRTRYGEAAWDELKAGRQGSYPVDLLFTAEIDSMYGNVQLIVRDCR